MILLPRVMRRHEGARLAIYIHAGFDSERHIAHCRAVIPLPLVSS